MREPPRLSLTLLLSSWVGPWASVRTPCVRDTLHMSVVQNPNRGPGRRRGAHAILSVAAMEKLLLPLPDRQAKGDDDACRSVE